MLKASKSTAAIERLQVYFVTLNANFIIIWCFPATQCDTKITSSSFNISKQQGYNDSLLDFFYCTIGRKRSTVKINLNSKTLILKLILIDYSFHLTVIGQFFTTSIVKQALAFSIRADLLPFGLDMFYWLTLHIPSIGNLIMLSNLGWYKFARVECVICVLSVYLGKYSLENIHYNAVA